MATSTLTVYENRNGIDNLYSAHTGLSGDIDETFAFPTGVWSVVNMAVYTSGDQVTPIMGLSYTNNYYAQSPQAWHVSRSGSAIHPFVMDSQGSFRRADGEYIALFNFKSVGLHFDRGDGIYVDGFDIDTATGGVVQLWVAAIRLQ